MDAKPIGERLEQDAARQARISLREELRRYWQVMTVYERFEQLVALVLSVVIAVVIVVALAGALLALGIVYRLVRDRDPGGPV